MPQVRRAYMNEEWRPVPGWENVYQVSSEGRVKNITRDVRSPWGFRKVEGRLMSLLANGNGYRFLYLKRGNTRTKAYVHRLVALAFIENPDGKTYVNHKNRDRADNRLANLEWATESKNTQHYLADDRAKALRDTGDFTMEDDAAIFEEIRPEDVPF